MDELKFDQWNPLEASAYVAKLNAELGRLKKENEDLVRKNEELTTSLQSIEEEKFHFTENFGNSGSEGTAAEIEKLRQINSNLSKRVIQLADELERVRTNKRMMRRIFPEKTEVAVHKQYFVPLLESSENIGDRIKDLSETGASIYVSRRLAVGEKINLRMFERTLKEFIIVRCQVVWCRETEGGKYLCGVQFVESNERRRTGINSIVKLYS